MIEKPIIKKPSEDIGGKKHKAEAKENLKQRAYLNTLSSMLDYAANRLTGLFVNPFVIAGLGTSLFGIWQMLGQFTGYVNIADTRSSQVLKWTVAQKKDVATPDELRSEAGAAFAVMFLLMPVLLIAGSVIAWYSPYITHAEKAHYMLIRITCVLLIFSVLVFKIFELFEAILRGMNLTFKRMGRRAGIVVLGGGLKVLALIWGFGLIGLAFVHLLETLAIGLSFYWVVKKNVGWFGINRPNRANILRFGKLSAWYLADAGANMVNTNSDKLLLGIITGPVSVAYYTLTKFIPAALQGLINRLILGIMPGVGKLIGLKEFEKVNHVRKNINRLSLLLTTAFGTTVILFNQSFLNFWVGKEHFAGHTVNTLIMVMTIQDTFVRNDACIISATLDIKRKVFLTLIAGVLFAGTGALLIYKMGITGLCISMMISRLFLFIGQRRVLTSLIKTETRAASASSLRPFVTTLAMLGAALWLATNTGAVGIYQLIILAPAAFGISLLLFYFLGLNSEDRHDFQKIFSSIKFFKSDGGFSKN
ncbi:lipopolysaccharide biosynthesis protein [Niastella sp. OAS944]|uniref:lipopolysaccharide biosynthesis protein n=1 Tax=Niastella sp. OAS944 TaxID=2664089 RepID=UPI00346AF65B|nr:O-antigen/teichoic acid export membrane protein [Chitinophagaceae bacterium OAS944]